MLIDFVTGSNFSYILSGSSISQLGNTVEKLNQVYAFIILIIMASDFVACSKFLYSG